jgi:hypothetical protein
MFMYVYMYINILYITFLLFEMFCESRFVRTLDYRDHFV